MAIRPGPGSNKFLGIGPPACGTGISFLYKQQGLQPYAEGGMKSFVVVVRESRPGLPNLKQPPPNTPGLFRPTRPGKRPADHPHQPQGGVILGVKYCEILADRADVPTRGSGLNWVGAADFAPQFFGNIKK